MNIYNKNMPYNPYNPYYNVPTPIISNDAFILTPIDDFMNLPYKYDVQMTLKNIPPYNSLNDQPDTKFRMGKFIYYKFLDEWIHTHKFRKILNYFKITNDNVSLLKDLGEYKKTNAEDYTKKDIKRISEYIEKHVLSKFDMYEILHDFILLTNYEWVYIPRYVYQLSDYMKERIIEKIEKKIIKK